MNVKATELKTRLGRYLNLSVKEPVFIEKNGQQHSVLISKELYEKFIAFEDRYWGELALQAMQDKPFEGNAMAEMLRIANEKGVNIDDHSVVKAYQASCLKND